MSRRPTRSGRSPRRQSRPPKSVDNAKIISYLHSGVTLQTVQGAVKFDALGRNGSATTYIFQWQGGKYVQVLPVGTQGSVAILNPKPAWKSLTMQGARSSARRRRAMGTELTSAVINGILGGGIYALMAVGLTLIFGVLDIINIAQGVMVILGAYLSYALSVHLHLDLFLGLLITVPAMFVIGVIIQVAFIRPLHGSERTSMSLLASYAVAIIIEGALYLFFGPNFVTLNASYVTKSVYLLGFHLPYIDLYGFAHRRRRWWPLST